MRPCVGLRAVAARKGGNDMERQGAGFWTATTKVRSGVVVAFQGDMDDEDMQDLQAWLERGGYALEERTYGRDWYREVWEDGTYRVELAHRTADA